MNPIRFGGVTKPPHRHRKPAFIGADGGIYYACGHVVDPAASKRAKSATRLGKDQERAFEKEHGPRKIGEFGDPVDHIGAFGKYQVKSTRSPVPVRLSHIARMDSYYLEKVPMLIERFVRHGVKTETFVTIRLRDWQALHGRDPLHEEPA